MQDVEATSDREEPTAPAGFQFGFSRERGKTACESAGHAWSVRDADVASCSGPAESVGFDAAVDLKFCGGAACQVGISRVLSENGAEATTMVRDALMERYGAAQETEFKFPQACRSDERFGECVANGRLKANYTWVWESGTRVKLRLRIDDTTSLPRLEILYSRKGASGVRPSAL